VFGEKKKKKRLIRLKSRCLDDIKIWITFTFSNVNFHILRKHFLRFFPQPLVILSVPLWPERRSSVFPRQRIDFQEQRASSCIMMSFKPQSIHNRHRTQPLPWPWPSPFVYTVTQSQILCLMSPTRYLNWADPTMGYILAHNQWRGQQRVREEIKKEKSCVYLTIPSQIKTRIIRLASSTPHNLADVDFCTEPVMYNS